MTEDNIEMATSLRLMIVSLEKEIQREDARDYDPNLWKTKDYLILALKHLNLIKTNSKQ